MTDIEPFRQHILKKVALSDAKLETFIKAFRQKQVKKKQFIIQPDFVTRHRNYVLDGAFRSYVIGNDGIEQTIQFAINDWWISDINSYFYQKPATLFVAALEDSTVMQIDFETEQQLKAADHQFETFFRIGAERTAAFHQRRIISSLTLSAEERYEEFLETYPDVAQRLPQYAIASYLGMTTEFLSRIRNDKVRKKLN
ncbi:Crp/Fnr family transcriptional regulator [Chitinophagaceae bacterium MMS25-I14]